MDVRVGMSPFEGINDNLSLTVCAWYTYNRYTKQNMKRKLKKINRWNLRIIKRYRIYTDGAIKNGQSREMQGRQDEEKQNKNITQYALDNTMPK